MSDPLPSPAADARMARVDRLLRWVWLIIGVLLLAMLVLGGGGLLVAFLSGMGGGSPVVPAATAGHARGSEAPPVRYDPPVAVQGTQTRVVLVRNGNGYTYTNTYSSSNRGEAPVVNVAFVDAGGVRLLLDRPAYIRRVAFPGHEHGDYADPDSAPSRLRWFVYEMSLRDTNGDGAIGDQDRRSLYVSGLDGRGLRQVLPDGYEPRDWAAQPDGSIFATALRLDGGHAERMPERAFVVDAAGTVRPYAQLDSAMDAAGTIIGGH